MADPKMEGGAEAKKFDIDTALNTKGFFEFLAMHPDAKSFDIKNEEEVGKRFEVFEMKALVAKDLRKLYSNQIEKEMGIKLDERDLSCIDAHVESKAIENPDEIKELRDKLDSLVEIPKEIKTLESELAKLGNAEHFKIDLEVLQSDSASLGIAKEHLGIFGSAKLRLKEFDLYLFKAIPLVFESMFNKRIYSDEEVEELAQESDDFESQENAITFVKSKYGDIMNWQAEELQESMGKKISEIKTTLDKIQELEQLKSLSEEMFGNLKKDLLGGMANIDDLTDSIQQKACKQLEEMLKDGSIKGLDKTQAKFDALKESARTSDTKINPLGAMDSVDEKLFQEQVDAALEIEASKEIVAAVERANMGTNALTKLEKDLEPFLTREKIGSKEGDEAREFITKTLEEAAENLSDTTEDKAKKFMIARILIKINSN